MLKIDEVEVPRRIEALRLMDRKLSDLHISSRYTIWQDWGGGLKKTQEETIANWTRIAEDDDLFNNALYCFMICCIQNYTLDAFKGFTKVEKTIEKWEKKMGKETD